MEMSFAKWPSALKMRLRLASACPSPFAYASLMAIMQLASAASVVRINVPLSRVVI